MANSLNSLPISVDQDLASFGAAQTLQSTPFGIRVWKLALVVSATTSSAGTVQVSEPNSGIPLLAPMVVPAASPTGTVLFFDNPTQLLQFRDFAVTGLTATGTRLFLWYRT